MSSGILNMHILTVIPFSANDALMAEHLCDLIAALNKNSPRGHCLIVAAPDTHGETHTKIRIAAEVAFETVDFLAVPWLKVIPTTKAESVNHLFYEASIHAARSCQWPYLWIEPDCVVLKENWLKDLTEAYYNQPKRYFGSILASPDGKTHCLSRVAVYPRGAGGEMKEFLVGKAPFEIAAGGIIVPRSAKSKLFQQLAYTSASPDGAIRNDALILHSDKQSILVNAMLDADDKKMWKDAIDDMHRTQQLMHTPPPGFVPATMPERVELPDPPHPRPNLEIKCEPPKRGPGRPRKELSPV